MNESISELSNLLVGLQAVQGNNEKQKKVFSVISTLISDICGDPSFTELTPQSQQKCNIILKYLTISRNRA